jgi:hypothetical protein
MKRSMTVMGVAALAATMLAVGSAAKADTGTAYVATANGSNAFSINSGGAQLYYAVQPDTKYNWYDQSGSLVTYTNGGVTANRDGMKTFAATDVGYGATIGSIQLSFQYASDSMTDGSGYPYGNYPTINVHITDGAGTYAIWSATSGGTGYTWGTPVAGREGWEQLTLNCTSFADAATFGKINESTNTTVLANGNLSAAVPWSTIKNWTVAGFYAEQFAPTGGWGAWGQNLWSDISEPGDLTPENRYGISLVWGDTVGSMNGDFDETYVGALAERDYGKKVKMIDNWVVGVGATNYDIGFVADVVPEPGTLAILIAAGLSLLGYAWRRRATA